MQKILRTLIVIAILITSYLLILAWRDDYATVATPNPVVARTGGDVPAVVLGGGDVPMINAGQAASQMVRSGEYITVSTDRYDIRINPIGGDIVYAALKQYDATLGGQEPFVLLENDGGRTYVAQSGLIGQDGIDTQNGRATYTSTKTHYQLDASTGVLQVPLVYQKDGVTITKTYTFKSGEYPIVLSYTINNTSAKDWQGQMYAQLKRDSSKDPGLSDKGMMGMATYLGGAWGVPGEPYNKLKFEDFNDELKIASKEGWVAIVQHYFVSAWTPNSFSGQFFSRTHNGENFIGFNSPILNVPAGKQMTVDATLYAGPKVQKELDKVAAGLNQTVDYGILWPISKTLFAILEGVYKILGNWGWSIIVLTLLVKLALMWFSNKSYVSMAKMRAIAPKLQAIKDKHGDDRMAMSQEMMQLYRDEKVNPMAGCLPILLQMPIFLALYWCLVESVELRHAPWILWIKDLSAMDPWFILPIFMGATMFVQQLLNPQPTDPMQAKIMKIMPLIFSVFMLFFPAGLVLYWTVNNLFSMAHQHFVNQRIEKQMKQKQA